jgi:hypothetical protein
MLRRHRTRTVTVPSTTGLLSAVIVSVILVSPRETAVHECG